MRRDDRTWIGWFWLSLASACSGASAAPPGDPAAPEAFLHCQVLIELRSSFLGFESGLEYHALFIDYLVGVDEFFGMVSWSEPRWGGRGNFCCEPETLEFSEAADGFRIRSQRQRLDHHSPPPYGARTTFTHLANSYNPEEMRFSLGAGRSRWLTLGGAETATRESLDKTDVRPVTVEALGDGRFRLQEMVPGSTAPRQTLLTYQTQAQGLPRLLTEYVRFPEALRPTGQTHTANVNGRQVVVGTQVVHHAGGRLARVEWAPLCAGLERELPRRIIVIPIRGLSGQLSPFAFSNDLARWRSAPPMNGGFLRSATILSARKLASRQEFETLRQALRAAGQATPEETEMRAIWGARNTLERQAEVNHQPVLPSPELLDRMRALRERCRRLGADPQPWGRSLQLQFYVVTLDFLLEDDPALATDFRGHLARIPPAALPEFALYSLKQFETYAERRKRPSAYPAVLAAYEAWRNEPRASPPDQAR
jgi:hypothetical protein